ncbi:MAG: hypothetical protein JXR37_04120 [Kiritimatiellae bacterium]|nr:hypothetical protein [Kiritimatiellia bacterium]
MTVRERFRATMKFQPVDRRPVIEWAPWWNRTVERWNSEGLPVKGQYELYEYFGLDMLRCVTFRAQTASCPKAASHGAGIVANEDDYEKVRPHLYPEPEMTDEWRAFAEEQGRGNCILRLSLQGYFWYPRQLLGIERHLYAFYDQADLMHRMNRDLVDWQVRVLDIVLDVFTPDFVTFAEDMSYNHGSMLSKELFDAFMAPYYRRISARLKGCETSVIVDSDGDVTEPAAWFRDVGVDGMLPLEKQAGVDIAALRRTYPGMCFMGHFDKMCMDKGDGALRREFERLLPTARRGGFVISVDHQTPPGVSLADYRTYVGLLKDYAAKAAR